MRTNKDVAQQLRTLASDLERPIMPHAAQIARKVLADNAPPSHNVESHVDIPFLGSMDYDVKRHLAQQSGHQLGNFIAKKLEHEWVAPGACQPMFNKDPFDMPRYRATVYVFTPEELKRYTERAVAAGQINS